MSEPHEMDSPGWANNSLVAKNQLAFDGWRQLRSACKRVKFGWFKL